jgi:hypothetical protein
MEALAISSMVMGSLFDIAGTSERIQAADQENRMRQQAINQRRTQEELAANNKIIQRQEQAQKIFGQQEAAIGASGLGASSASFKFVEENQFDEFAKAQHTDLLNLSFQEDALNQQSEQSQLADHYAKENAIFQGAASLFDTTTLGALSFGKGGGGVNSFGSSSALSGRSLPEPGSSGGFL